MYNYKKIIAQLPKKISDFIQQDKDLIQHIKKWKLDTEEITLLVEQETGERQTINNKQEEKETLIQIAKNTIKHLQKKKQLTIRLQEQDLIKLKTKALQQGIPYQTLLGSIVHQYVNS